MIYKFVDTQGTFTVNNPQQFSHLYFPLTNKEGSLLSSISPNLAGDIKKDNHRFLTPPAGIEDLGNNFLCRRDFFIKMLPSNKVIRLSTPAEDVLEAGFLYHKLIKHIDNLEIEILNFIPFDLDVEIMNVKIKNNNNLRVEFIPTSFIPLYGRSESNLRDHRHVTSLLNRISLIPSGIILAPSMVFDEQGHRPNETLYFVLGYQQEGTPILGQFPTLLCFCGESGNLGKPEAIYNNPKPFEEKIPSFDGKEVCAAFRFKKARLKKGEEITYTLIMGIGQRKKNISQIFRKLDSQEKIENYLEETKKFWRDSFSSLRFDFKDTRLNNWLLWVNFQPTLRKLFGCSFLPHFDYGKGGRGFRDLWQDILNLILRDEKDINKLILNNFKSLKIDGSNATIITKKGGFLSDRNKITRVWSDHGIWPFLSTKLYLNRTADFGLLFKNIPYFKDHQLKRAGEIDLKFQNKDYLLRTKKNKIYLGSLLEHLLVENLVQFFNVGKHNLLRLENGDWNDGLDMAASKGESIPFYCMYAYNLKTLAGILERIKEKHEYIEILEEITLLLDIKKTRDYSHALIKRKILERYLEKTKNSVSGKKVKIKTPALANDLRKKADWVFNYVRKNEFLSNGFFNGYYDNKSRKVEGRVKGRIRMLLQSQVFPVMSGTASDYQIKEIWKSINRHLKDKRLGGYRLNTDFKTLYLDLGRAFGFSYGDKENGAFFNHMVVLLAFALYERDFIKEGYLVINSLYRMAESDSAKIYPMIPEYFNSQGRGLYFYLTGSASWYIYTLFEKVLGIKFLWGNLIIKPGLLKEDFRRNTIETTFLFLRRKFKLIFIRPHRDEDRQLQQRDEVCEECHPAWDVETETTGLRGFKSKNAGVYSIEKAFLGNKGIKPALTSDNRFSFDYHRGIDRRICSYFDIKVDPGGLRITNRDSLI